ncbi:MAG: hypothetical protein J6Z11_10025, partial [Candidatus Riflebacteria bacterium]|nr:hypothetical protein [Candidatus Riflebacteria bacterium]
MKNKSLKLVFGLMLLSVLFIIAGCGGGGGGQKVATQSTPEETVLRTFETWRVSPETSPSIVVDESGKFIRQATAAEVVTP